MDVQATRAEVDAAVAEIIALVDDGRHEAAGAKITGWLPRIRTLAVAARGEAQGVVRAHARSLADDDEDTTREAARIRAHATHAGLLALRGYLHRVIEDLADLQIVLTEPARQMRDIPAAGAFAVTAPQKMDW